MTENNRKLKEENVELKARIDILYKLSKSYLDKYEKENNQPALKDDSIVVIEESVVHTSSDQGENVSNDGNVENIREPVPQRQVSFSEAAAQERSHATEVHSHPVDVRVNSRDERIQEGSRSRTNSETNGSNINDESPQGRRPRYCHYFTNSGKCTYEENTGNTCKFLHEKAPLCHQGTTCTRPKCMFTHPKNEGRNRNPFLSNQNQFAMTVNPWQMINPWWNQFPGLPNPWIQQAERTRNQWPRNQ